MMVRVLWAMVLACLLGTAHGADRPIRIAVASNFAATAEELAAAFSNDTGTEIEVTLGSTGLLTAQIVNGAPFDVLLAADEARPRYLVAKGRAEERHRMTYAIGRLALWSDDPDLIDPARGTRNLRDPDVGTVAIANPAVAPYGAAAAHVLDGIDGAFRIVRGENVGYVRTLVATGNADAGFIAAALLPPGRGSYWLVPADRHPPIRQDALLLDRGAGNARARAFFDFLGTDRAAAIIAAHGYDLPGR